MVHNYLEGHFEEAKKAQLEAIGLINALFSEVNPIPIKEALNLLGYSFGLPRLPLTPLTDANKSILENEMKQYGLL